MRLRSPLFAPADQPRKIIGAIASEADCVILDLEDSVAAAGKPAARQQAADTLRQGPRERIIVRVNAIGTPWYLEDLAAIVACGPAAIMLPKASGTADVLALHHHLQALEAAAGRPPTTGILPIVTETAASVAALHEYRDAPRVLALCFGAEDLSADLGIPPRIDGALNPVAAMVRAQVLLAAAAAGVPALETPYPDHRDAEGCARAARDAARDGFAGMLLIHPAQIAAANEAFTPDPERLDWARRVRDAARSRPDAGVFALDGHMIDRPHLRLAARLLGAVGEPGI